MKNLVAFDVIFVYFFFKLFLGELRWAQYIYHTYKKNVLSNSIIKFMSRVWFEWRRTLDDVRPSILNARSLRLVDHSQNLISCMTVRNFWFLIKYAMVWTQTLKYTFILNGIGRIMYNYAVNWTEYRSTYRETVSDSC